MSAIGELGSCLARETAAATRPTTAEPVARPGAVPAGSIPIPLAAPDGSTAANGSTATP